MILKCASFIFLVNLVLAQAQNSSSALDIKNSEFFQKFFIEFHKQYELLQQRKNVTTLSPSTTTYETSTIQSNTFPQNTDNFNFNNRNTSQRPTINPKNPYFTISPDSIRPTRRPHFNPFLRIRTTTQATTITESTLANASTEERKHDAPENQQTSTEKLPKRIIENNDNKIDFLSFVQSALVTVPKEHQHISTEQQNSTHSVQNLVKKLIKIVPNSRSKTRPKIEAEVKLRPRDDVFTTKIKPKDDHNNEVFEMQTQNAKYSFAFDEPKMEAKVELRSRANVFLTKSKPKDDYHNEEFEKQNAKYTFASDVAKIEPEVSFRPRGDVFTTKSEPKDDYHDEESNKQAQNAKYTFTSDVQDTINGNIHKRHEQREGNKVTGMYTYEDGFFRRTVHYEADEKGYRVVKEDVQEIGNGPLINPDGSAKIKAFVAGNVVNYQVTNEDIYRRKPIRYQSVQEPQFYYSHQ